MDLYEHQARDLFAAHGVAVPRGRVVAGAEQAAEAAAELGCAVVVKAQVKTGGRGKAGGIRLAGSPAEAADAAAAMLGMDIKGHTVHRVLVVEASDIARELYVSFLLDRANREFLAMASAEGGMEIEQLAAERPQALARIPIDPLTGCDATKAKEIAAAALLPPEAADVLVALWAAFVAQDATLVEVNPLAVDGGGRILALDGKVTLDGNAAFRHPEHATLDDPATRDPLERAAAERGLNYVKLDGQVGVIGNGAGLVMATLDVVALAGQRHGVGPANFLDLGGGASAQVMTDGLDIVLRDPDVRSVFVNIFGGITACDQVAAGIVAALANLGDAARKPIVVRLDGNNVEAGIAILDAATHPLVTVVDTMDGAAELAAELASGGRP